LRLAAHIEGLGSLGLHAESQFERSNAGLQRGVVLARFEVPAIELL
jgi:hypothetical protein